MAYKATVDPFNALGRIGYSTVSDKMKDRNTVYKIIFISCIVISLIALATFLNSCIIIWLVLLNAHRCTDVIAASQRASGACKRQK